MRFRSWRRGAAAVTAAALYLLAAPETAMAYPPSVWTLQTGTMPSARTGAAMAYLPGTGLVMYGGCNISPCPTDTWKWTGTSWSQITGAGAVGPNFCDGAKMVYDSANTQLVLVCSKFAAMPTGVHVATWTFDGTTWTDRTFTSTLKPSERQEYTLTYDQAAARVVLFGGYANTGQIRNDTWELNATPGLTFQWTETVPQNSPGSPTPRYGAAAAYHLSSGKSVVFGGSGGGASQPTDTWGYAGGAWTLLSTVGPTGRYRAAMTYDNMHNELVLHGGFNLTLNSHMNDTWAWALTGAGWAWTPHAAVGGPLRFGMAMAYHPLTDKTVLFGGQPLPGGATNDTYTYGWP